MALQSLDVRNALRHSSSFSLNPIVGELNARAFVKSIIRVCSVTRPLRWHERLLLRLLLRSLRVDRVLILQYRRATSQQCRVFAAQMQLEFCRQHLEQLYRSSRDH